MLTYADETETATHSLQEAARAAAPPTRAASNANSTSSGGGQETADLVAGGRARPTRGSTCNEREHQRARASASSERDACGYSGEVTRGYSGEEAGGGCDKQRLGVLLQQPSAQRCQVATRV
jgi:hypothetical protein